MPRNEIQELTQKLANLAVETNRIIDALQTISNEIEATGSPGPTTALLPSPPGPTDRTGTPLHVGLKVRFLTKGLFTGEGGTITKFGKARATVLITQTGRKTTRAFRNLQVVQAQHDGSESTRHQPRG